MNHGLLRVGCATAKVSPANPKENANRIIALYKAMEEEGVEVALFPELALSGFDLGDLFRDRLLLQVCEEQLEELVFATEGGSMVLFVGVPVIAGGSLYNSVAVIQGGKLLALVPRDSFRQQEIYDLDRSFSTSFDEEFIDYAGCSEVYFGGNPVFRLNDRQGTKLAVGFQQDLFSSRLSAEADLVLIPAAWERTVYSRNRLEVALISESYKGWALAYCSAGEGESTTDRLFGGDQFLAECGELVEENLPSDRSGWIYADLDLEKVRIFKRKQAVVRGAGRATRTIPLAGTGSLIGRFEPERVIDYAPFVPKEDGLLEEILAMQAESLVKRMEHIHADQVFLGVSGGLDSTLALLVCLRSFDQLGLSRDKIRCITMPAFGTSRQTHSNAWKMGEKLGVSFREINITEAVRLHFRDIGLDEDDRSLAFENAQARERTQILMDLANKEGGIVIGTGDMSEIALGWSTYNGDHMSMYAVNASIPKMLVRALVGYEADRMEDRELADILRDVIATPVSPELLPTKEGEISQKTEDLIGPYEIHDFYLYHYLHYGFTPSKLLFMAEHAFEGRYDRRRLLESMKIFFSRFFNSQFKRSASVDSITIWPVSLSPRGGWRMPSDVVKDCWLEEISALLEE